MTVLKKWAAEARERKALHMATWGPVTVMVDDILIVNGCFEAGRGWVFNIDLVSDNSENGVHRVTQIPIGAYKLDRAGAGEVARQLGLSWNANLIPDEDLQLTITSMTQQHPKQGIKKVLANWLPKRLIEARMQDVGLNDIPLNQLNSHMLQQVVDMVQHWRIQPNGTEGYRTAEVTCGGVSTAELSSKTMMSKKVNGLYFIGEVVDVTGHLGGFNLQWAWSSGYVAGEVV